MSMQIFVTDAEAYKSVLAELGEAYRRSFGRHHPAIAVFEVSRLFGPEACVEGVCVAVTDE